MRPAGLAGRPPGVHPVSGPLTDPTVKRYVEGIVWAEMRHAVTSRGREAGMDDADLARATDPLTPGPAGLRR